MSDDQQPMNDDAGMLTIAEAAARLGIGEKRLRRLLTRTEYRGRTRTGTRTTRTGQRQASMLPEDLLRDLEARLHLEQNGDNADRDADKDIEPEVSASPIGTGTRTETRQVVLSAFYERILAEKDARLAEMAAALDHERAQSRRLSEALAREQALRSLPAPGTYQEAAQDVPDKASDSSAGDTQDGVTGKDAAEAVGRSQGQAVGFWARLFGNGKQRQ